MTPEAKKALEKSIIHWAENVEQAKNGMGFRMSASSCALCGLFLFDAQGGACTNCPVSERTGEPGCDGTPWASVWAAVFIARETSKIVQACENELEFLKSLRENEGA